MKATFENSVNVLVKAYFNGKLKFMDCSACAVGNIIAAGGYIFNGQHGDHVTDQWLRMIVRDCRGYSSYPCDQTIANEQIQYSGYDVWQLNQIELAFEGAKFSVGEGQDQRQFNGLMRVVDVLAEIHGIDLKAKEEAKLLFVKA